MLQRLTYNLVVFLILASGIFSWAYVARSRPVPPCSRPIPYSIGSFDQRFGITEENFLSALGEAEMIWEQPIGKDLFSYAPKNAKLPINLIYDYRQAATQKLSQIEEVVDETEASYSALESQYAVMKKEYEGLKASYDAKVSSLDREQKLYEERVSAWNSGSHASKSEFQALEASRRALEQEVAALRQLEENLNQKGRELNALIARLNRTARTLNLNVDEYNTIGTSRGETFEGGTYSSSEDGDEKIDIYEFENHTELVRLLAHELGHALGLEHVPDHDAIMYEVNEGENLKANASDLAALNALCSSKR